MAAIQLAIFEKNSKPNEKHSQPQFARKTNDLNENRTQSTSERALPIAREFFRIEDYRNEKFQKRGVCLFPTLFIQQCMNGGWKKNWPKGQLLYVTAKHQQMIDTSKVRHLFV